MLTHLKRADEVLTGLLTRDLGKKDSPEGSSDSRSTRKERHLLRYNQSLLSSLKEHTHEKVRWAALDEWKQAWDGCIDGVIDIWVEAIRIIGQKLELAPELRDRLYEAGGGTNIPEQMVGVVTERMWQGVWGGETEQGYELVNTEVLPGRGTEIASGKKGSLTAFILTDAELAEGAANICGAAARGLYQGEKQGLARVLSGYVSRVQSARNELEDMLNPLVLRPLIIRTRCDLCPA